MSESTAVVERRMPLADYLALPDELRAEYVDGTAIVSPPPTFAHQKICHRLVSLLEVAVPQLEVVGAAGWRLPALERIRIPDVMVLREAPPGPLVTAVPLLAIEVLSTNRSEDLVRKSTEYLDAGVGQYWVVDPRDRVIDVYLNTERGWNVLAHVTDDQPSVAVDVDDHGRVELDLAYVLG